MGGCGCDVRANERLWVDVRGIKRPYVEVRGNGRLWVDVRPTANP